MAYTEEQLALLSDEERAALEEDGRYADEEGKEDATDAAKPDAAAKDDAAENDQDDASDDGGTQEAEQAETEEEPETPAATDPEPDPAPVTQEAPPPVVPTKEIAAQEAKVDELDKKADDLLAKYNDGDIDDDDYKAQLADIRKEARAAASQLGKLQAQKELAEKSFYDAADAHLDAYPEIRNNPDYYNALDAEQYALSQLPAYRNVSHKALFEAAHRAVAAAAEIKGVKGFPKLKKDQSAKAEAPAKPGKPEAPKTTKNDGLGETPNSLKDMPAAAAIDADESEMAELSKLNPLEFEAAWAAMSPEKRERLRRYA